MNIRAPTLTNTHVTLPEYPILTTAPLKQLVHGGMPTLSSVTTAGSRQTGDLRYFYSNEMFPKHILQMDGRQLLVYTIPAGVLRLL